MAKDDKRKSVAQPSRRAFLTGAVRRLRGDDWTLGAAQAVAVAPVTPVTPVTPASDPLPKGPDTSPEGALVMLREQAKANTKDVAARKRLGFALFRLDYLVQARVEFEQVLRLGKNEDPDVLLHLGLILARAGKTDKAAAVWGRYVATGAEPARPEIENLLARLASDAPPTAPEMADSVERAMGMAGSDSESTSEPYAYQP
jgi:hypothetical protein